MCYLCWVSSRPLVMRRILGCLWAVQERELLSITEVCHRERPGHRWTISCIYYSWPKVIQNNEDKENFWTESFCGLAQLKTNKQDSQRYPLIDFLSGEAGKKRKDLSILPKYYCVFLDILSNEDIRSSSLREHRIFHTRQKYWLSLWRPSSLMNLEFVHYKGGFINIVGILAIWKVGHPISRDIQIQNLK